MLNLKGVLSAEGGLLTNKSQQSFSPLDLSPILWFDASDESTITESAGAVSQWDDKSGNDLHAVQGVGASQPTFSTDQIIFDGGDDLALPDLSAYFNGSQNRTIFVVGQIATTASDECFIGMGPATTGNKFQIMTKAGALRIELTDGSENSTHVLAVDTDYIIALKLDGTAISDLTYFLDGTADALSNASAINTDASSDTYIGRQANGDKLNGVIREIIAFDSALSDADMNQIGNYLENKWSLTWTDI